MKSLKLEIEKIERDCEYIFQEILENENKKINLFEDLKLKCIEIPKKDIIKSKGNSVITLDYSILEIKEYENMENKLDIEKILKRIEEINLEMKTKNEKIDEYSSNLGTATQENRADLEKMQNNEEKLKQVRNDMQKLLDDEKKIVKDFENIKNSRLQTFKSFFDEVEKIINSIYKGLTRKNENFETGGNAYLYLSNSNEPYKGGIIYCSTPPTKTYF